jgi:hypothetical protein
MGVESNQFSLFEPSGKERLQQLALKHNLHLSIKLHPRSKRLRIKIRPHISIEITAPTSYPKSELDRYILTHWDWIERTIQKHLAWAQKAGLANSREQSLPDRLNLRTISEEWRVLSCSTKTGETCRLRESDHLTLNLTHASGLKQGSCQRALKLWLNEKARNHLTPRLNELSQQTGLTYNMVRFRAQKTRWGSCSSKKNINLNQNLLFLPPELTRYVMLHELCHTLEMNHSKRFWLLVEHVEPRYQQMERALKHAQALIPLWLLR